MTGIGRAGSNRTTVPAAERSLEDSLESAHWAALLMEQSTPAERAEWLRLIASSLTAEQDQLIDVAGQETHLPQQRLSSELKRTCTQLRHIADAVDEGSWLEVIIDHANPEWPTGPRPDLRRMQRPVGPVLVIAAGNFPFAFSVAGSDTATALGAGCPVVVKAHPGHPQLSRLTAQIVDATLADGGAPAGSFCLIEGEEATQRALRDPRIKAGSFTGSLGGGRALLDIANNRPAPIPFYAEMGSVNPVFVLPSAIRSEGSEIVDGFVDSFTLGAGQFCTKPGLLFIPRSEQLLGQIRERVSSVKPAPLLNDQTVESFQKRVSDMTSSWTLVAEGSITLEGATPWLFTAPIDSIWSHLDELSEEVFGPCAIVIEYDEADELARVARLLPGQLTASVHGQDGDPHAATLIPILARSAGRTIWNGWPTGVSVTWAMHHGGPWPSTSSSLHTSVGATAIRRFLSPSAYQGLPASLLPYPLRDNNPLKLPQRVNGEIINHNGDTPTSLRQSVDHP